MRKVHRRLAYQQLEGRQLLAADTSMVHLWTEGAEYLRPGEPAVIQSMDRVNLPVETQFRMRAADGVWQVVQPFSQNRTLHLDTSSWEIGQYYVGSEIRLFGTESTIAHTTPITVTVSHVPPATSVSIVEQDDPLKFGRVLEIHSQAEGGSGEYEYQFRKRSIQGAWQTITPYSDSNVLELNLSALSEGPYFVGAFARSAGSPAPFEVSATPIKLNLAEIRTANATVTASGEFGRSFTDPADWNGTVLVATCDSSDASKAAADYVGDCDGDQAEINAAINALPPAGGRVQLAEGTFEIRVAASGIGGVIIDRDNVTLAGVGNATKLLLSDDQNTSVVRIAGDGTSNITIRDLYINGNWEENRTTSFIGSGIYGDSVGSTPLENITVSNTFVEDSARLNVFVRGSGVQIVDNRFGDSRSDSVEILTGPGFISNNTFQIDATTGYVISTDQANDVTISNNIIQITSSGRISQSVIRTWGGRYAHVITGNQVRNRGVVNRMLEVNSYISVINDNLLLNYGPRATSVINAAAVVSGNVFHNVDTVFAAKANWASTFSNNLLFYGSEVENRPFPGVQAELYRANNVRTP